MMTPFGSALLCPNGYYQIKSTKEGNKDKYLHRLIFEDYYGVTLLDGVVIHHKDENKENNDINNLEAMYSTEHSSKHNKGRVFSQKTRRKMSENHSDVNGENNPMWKGYATLVKKGFRGDIQNYAILKKGKILKQSIFPEKLIKWFNEHFPNEELDVGGIYET